jgi:hypothetical protein
VPDAFNPYREWLGLEAAPASPDFYQLLGVERDAEPERVKQAADYAINRVRSVRPGKRAAEWTRLIDELRTAQNVLADPQRRAAYDAALPPTAPRGNQQPFPAETPVAAPGSIDAYPPLSPLAPQPAAAPVAGAPAAYNYADPMAPVSLPGDSIPGQSAPAGVAGNAVQVNPPAAALPQVYAPVGHYAAPVAYVPGAAGGVPFARPVGVPMAVPSVYAPQMPPPSAAPQPAAYAAPPAPLSAPAAPAPVAGAPVISDSLARPSSLPAPVKVRRRRGTHVQYLVLLGVAATMIALVVVALVAGLNSPDDDATPANQVARRGASDRSSSNRRAANPSRARPSFVPPASSNRSPLESSATSDDSLPMAEEPPMTSDSATSPSPSPMPVASAPPEPMPAAPAREPSDAEKAQTEQALQAASAALGKQDFDGADSQLAQVEALPKTPEAEKTYAGARQLAQSARAFSKALDEGFTGLKAEQEITFNNSTVKVKETSADSLTIEVVEGVTKKYTRDNLPLGLKYGLVNTIIPPDDPANALAKAAWHATQPDGDLTEARHFLEVAAAAGADVDGVLAVINKDAPAATVASAPEPMPATPATTPEPTPAPAPTPSPEPAPAPTAKELEELTKLAQTARTALEERNLDEANELIAKAESLAKLPEHQEKIANLKQLAHYTSEFWRAVDESLKTLSNMGELTIGDNVISIIESRPNHVVIKVAGQVKRYNRRDMPGGLAMAIANLWFKEDDAAAKAARGALYSVEKKGDPGRARELWQEAGQMGLDTSSLLLTLDEEFDFTVAESAPTK